MIKIEYIGRLRVRKSHIQMAIDMFLERGFSSHSPEGAILVHIMNYCIEHGIPFQLSHYPGLGSSLKRLEPIK